MATTTKKKATKKKAVHPAPIVPNEGWLNVTDFGVLTGIPVQTISLAIRRGGIPEEMVQRGRIRNEGTYINPQPASVHWFSRLNANHPATRTLHAKLAEYISTFDAEAVAGNASPPPQVVPRKQGEQGKLTSQSSLAEAQRVERVAKAGIASLELSEKQGSLVQKKVVQNQLFTAGQELRNAMLAIPDRITDEIIALSGDRNRIHRILQNAIADELQKLADIYGRKLG